MNRFFYFFVYSFSLIPFRILYVFSHIIYFSLYHIIGYRKKVIRKNLKKSFPEKSEKEIKEITKKFYKNFSDYLVETLKGFSISEKELDKRHTYSNLEVFDEIKEEGRNVMLMCGHVFNWEWFIGLVKHLKTEQTVAVYHTIKNTFWNDKVNNMRARFNTIPVDMKDTIRFIMRTPNDGSATYLFVADQSPKKSMIYHSLKLLNQDTPVFIGFDKIAIKKDMAVVYCKTVKQKQGYYHTSFERICPEQEKFLPYEIVNAFFAKLEQTIIENPDNWLWSHKRWKYKKGKDY